MKDRTLFTIAVILCSVVFLPRGSPAAIFDVTTPAQFQAALTTAEGNGQDDTINVAAGTYNLTSTLTYNGVGETFGLTIEGAGAGVTILDGGNSVQIMNLTGAGPIIVRGITFQNGSTGSPINFSGGGGLSASASPGSITIQHCVFDNNTANLFPGGGAELGGDSITVDNTIFTNNSTTHAGGGLRAGSDNVTLTHNTFFMNSSGGGGGAELENSGAGTINMVVVNNVFNLNLGSDHGLRVNGFMEGLILLTSNTFTTNQASGDLVEILSVGGSVEIWNNILRGGNQSLDVRDPDVINPDSPTVNIFNNLLTSQSVTLDNASRLSQGDNITGFVDPRFVDQFNGDVHLLADSPAIDNGANAAPGLPAADIDGDARIINGTVDIGVDEFTPTPQPDIAVTPASITFPDVIQAQSSAPEEVTISNTGTAALNVSGIAPVTGTHYSVAVGGSNACPNLTPTVAAGGNCTVQVTFSPLTVANNIADTLAITSNDPDEGTVNVPLSGNGVAGPTPNIGVAPTSITFTDIVVGNSSTPDNVTISNTGTAALNVSGISLDDTTNFSLDLSGGPNGCGIATPSITALDNCTVSVTFTPQSEASFGATLTVASNDPDTPNATVSLSGNGTPAPAPNISVPATVALGEVVVNDNSAPSEVAITNTGNLVLNVSSISLDAGTDFTLDLSGGSNPCGGATPSIAAGDNCTMAVVFSPLSVGGIIDNLAITSDDPDQPSVNSSLSGTGLDNVTPTVTSATASGSIMLDTSGNAGTFFSDVQALLDTDPSLNQTGKPPEQFPHGITAFKINNVTPGGTVMMDITLPAAIPGGSIYHVVGTGGFAPFNNVALSGNTATLTLVDGGSGDIDGTADGMITHTGGLATPAPSPPSGGDNGCNCRIAGKGGMNADSVGTAAVLVIPFLWLALVRRLNNRKR